ncbi:MAG: pilus assembly PilX N-terminal domain-containing protein [Trueperaceae bacterium]|nr:MAG: pilus assembly PilX N-terminal domain-containing protein [Trueperaceae bacterium]
MASRESGIALVTSLSILTVVALMVVGAFFTTQIELWNTRNDATFTQANYAAQAGLQKYKSALFQYYRWVEQNYTPGANPVRTACYNRLGSGIDWNRDPSDGADQWSNNQISRTTETVYEADGVTPIGTFDVTIFRDNGNSNLYSVQSVGRSGGARATVRATFLIVNSGILEQAIFTGDGGNNRSINGGATVRGGVYVVGDPNLPEQVLINANGDFSLLNSYDLDASDYNSRDGIVAKNYVNPENHTADNLCTMLRVENGQVAVSGSAVLGQPDNQLLGVYVSDGGRDDIIAKDSFLNTCTANKGVCTDELSHFDISNPPDFPDFDGTPNQHECTLDTWRQCIHASTRDAGLAIRGGSAPSWPSGATLTADFSTLAACTQAFASTEVVLDAQSFDCSYQGLDGNRYGIAYDGSTTPALLEVYGNVTLTGVNLTFARNIEFVARSQGAYGTDNQASLVLEDDGSGLYGNLDINGHFLPKIDPGDQNATSFPNHVLALIAEQNVYQRGEFAFAPIYSGGIFRNVKDNILFGQVVTRQFCTTSAGDQTDCAAGQRSEIVYMNTANNKPEILRQINDKAGDPTFRVLSYELR